MDQSEPFRRRIDRVVAEDYLADVENRSAEELRKMRDECGVEESRLSYQRRLLHGQLDIAKAELARRDSGETASLVETLNEILSDGPSGGQARSAGNTQVYRPHDPSRRDDDNLLDHMPLGSLPDLGDDELVAVVTRLATEEASVSALRRKVLDHLDRLQRLLIQQYRDGGASIDDVVGRAAP